MQPEMIPPSVFYLRLTLERRDQGAIDQAPPPINTSFLLPAAPRIDRDLLPA
jgi:hypothetical protein